MSDREPMPLEWRLFWILLIVLLLPFTPIIFAVPRLLFGLLWDYAAAVVVGIAFPVVFILTMRKGKSITVSVCTAVKSSVISLGKLLVLLFIFSLFYGPGYKPFTLGYWIHTKIWLNPVQVRQWAANQLGSTNVCETIPHEQWPTSLKNTGSDEGSLYIDSKTKTLTLVEGGVFGHWGITIVQEKQTNDSSREYVLKLEKGAWVWHELQ